MIKKIRNKYYKYKSYRKNGVVKTLYLGKANWFNVLLYKIRRLI